MEKPEASILARMHILDGLSENELTRITDQCDWRRYDRDQLILDRDSTSTDVYFVLEGEVRVVNYSVLGREVRFATFQPGEYFGELAAIDDLPRSASVHATGDTLVAVISGEKFRAILARHSNTAMHVMRRLARFVRDSDDRIMDLSTLSAFQRVYSEILKRAKADKSSPGQWILRPYPSDREIASRAGVTQDTVARAIVQLRQAGLAKRKNLNLHIRDRDKINSLIERYRIISGA